MIPEGGVAAVDPGIDHRPVDFPARDIEQPPRRIRFHRQRGFVHRQLDRAVAGDAPDTGFRVDRNVCDGPVLINVHEPVNQLFARPSDGVGMKTDRIRIFAAALNHHIAPAFKLAVQRQTGFIVE